MALRVGGGILVIEIKGYRDGLRFIIKKTVLEGGPKDLERVLHDKISTMGDFLVGAEVMFELESAVLSPDDVQAVVRVLDLFPQISLVGIRSYRPGTASPPASEVVRPERSRDVSPSAPSPQAARSTANGPSDRIDLHYGTLRSGQRVFSPRSLLIFGNVNPGGRVVAHGNLYVMGSLGGIAAAGAGGNTRAFIYAEIMDPLQLYIGDRVARSTDRSAPEQPEYAVVEGDQIIIYPASDSFLRHLRQRTP